MSALWTITLSSKDAAADWAGVLRPQTVEANNLREALTKALEIPFRDWVVDEGGLDGIEIVVDGEPKPCPCGQVHCGHIFIEEPT